jgi:hypothetical protein
MSIVYLANLLSNVWGARNHAMKKEDEKREEARIY